MQNLIQREKVSFQEKTISYQRNVNENEIYSTIKSYKQFTTTGTQQTFANGNDGPIIIDEKVEKRRQVRNFWGEDSSVKMYSSKDFYQFATFNHLAQENKKKLRFPESMKTIRQSNPEIRFQQLGSSITRKTVQSYPLQTTLTSNNVKQRMMTSTYAQGQLTKNWELTTQYQSGRQMRGKAIEWIQQEIERPKYGKLYNNISQLYRNLAPEQDPVTKKTICGPVCWVLWGLIGLIGALLGIAFGLGLISGLGIKGFDIGGVKPFPAGNQTLIVPNATVPEIEIPSKPVVPIIPVVPQKPSNITVPEVPVSPQIPTIPVVPIVPIVPTVPPTQVNKTQITGEITPIVIPPIFEGQNFIEPQRIKPIRIQTTQIIPLPPVQTSIQPSTTPQINYIEPSVTSPFIHPSTIPQIIPSIEPSTTGQIFYPVPVPQIFIPHTTPEIIYPLTTPQIIQPQTIQQTQTFISPEIGAPQQIEVLSPIFTSPTPIQKAIEVSTAPSTIFIKDYTQAVPITTQVSSNISDNKHIFANTINQNKETPVTIPSSTQK